MKQTWLPRENERRINRETGIDIYILLTTWASQLVLGVKTHLPMQETQGTRIQPLGLQDPLEGEMATHSSILAWRTQWTEESGGLQSTGLAKSRTRLK